MPITRACCLPVFGRSVTIANAVTILAPVMFGVDFHSEKGQYALRERLFQLVAWYTIIYTLSNEETEAVLYSDEAEREIFLMGLVIKL